MHMNSRLRTREIQVTSPEQMGISQTDPQIGGSHLFVLSYLTQLAFGGSPQQYSTIYKQLRGDAHATPKSFMVTYHHTDASTVFQTQHTYFAARDQAAGVGEAFTITYTHASGFFNNQLNNKQFRGNA